MIAKLIAGRSALGNSRQIFFCQIGGHDTHASMLPSHANLMAELSGALLAFRNTLADPGLDAFDDVTTFTMSDFNRTLQANGNDAGAGSDHAWGGHHIIDRWGTPYFFHAVSGEKMEIISAGSDLRMHTADDISSE